MKHTATNTTSLIYIEKVENLYIEDKLELATTSYIYIEKAENFHIGKIGLTANASYHQQASTSPQTSPIPTLNHSQVVLAIYYVLMSWGIHPRVNVDLAHVARLIHLITAKPYNSIHNSDFYKKLQQVPRLKSKRGLIKDLELIKSRLLAVGLKEAASLVDRELTIARGETNNGHI